jgi:hypothetical protein
MSIANGLVRAVKGKRVARFNLAWDVLPLSRNTLRDFGKEQFFQPERKTYLVPSIKPLTVRESQLPLTPLPSVATSPATVTLSELQNATNALFDAINSRGKIEPPTITLWDSLFKSFWLRPGNAGYQAAATGAGVSRRNYFGLLRDHAILYQFLAGNKMRLVLELPEQETVYVPPAGASYFSVRRYTFNPNQDIAFDRYTVTAGADPFDAELGDVADNSDVPLAVTGVWQSGNGFSPLAPELTFENQTIKFAAPPSAADLSEDSATTPNTGNWLEAILHFGGNTSLGDVSSKLFSSGKNSSVFAGALISKGKVDNLVGLNYEGKKRGAATPGVTIGIATGGSGEATLFAGPSLSFDAIQLAIGGRLTSSENGTDTSIRLRPAITLSFDLSRALGGKEEITKLKLDNTKVSSDWGKTSDEVLSENQGFYVDVSISSQISGAGVSLVQVKSSTDQTPTDAKVEIPLQIGVRQLISVPKGVYLWKFVFPNQQSKVLKTDNGVDVPFSDQPRILAPEADNSPQSFTLKIVPAQ